MNEKNASICEYCRLTEGHQTSCPENDTVAIQIWKAGFQAGLNGQRNSRACDETYSLGFTSGEMERERLNASEKRDRPSTPEELFPEEAPEPRPRNSFPSVTELTLAMQEKHDPPPIPGDTVGTSEPSDEHGVPPVLRTDNAKAVYDREIAARHADLY